MFIHTLTIHLKRSRAVRIVLILIMVSTFPTAAGADQPFDFDQGNAPFEIIIPTVIPVILEDISPSAGDPSLIFRITALVTNGWFDAIAPYHETAVGVYSQCC